MHDRYRWRAETHAVTIPAPAAAARPIWLGGQGPAGSRPRRAARGDAAPAARTPQVLIVDDEIFVAWHLEAMIRTMSFEVCGVAGKGREAVRLAAEHKPDLVLMDVNLHDEMDGIEAARRIRELTPAPIIFVTAYSDDETRRRIAMAVPDASVLAKPIGEAQLRSAIRAALGPPSA